MMRVFSDLVFKIRLISLGFSFRKQKVLYLNLQPTDCQSGVITITQTEPTVSRKKAFNTLQSCLTDSSSIHLILLIQLILYKIGKTRLKLRERWICNCYTVQSFAYFEKLPSALNTESTYLISLNLYFSISIFKSMNRWKFVKCLSSMKITSNNFYKYNNNNIN